MICPYCETEMEKGIIQNRPGSFYTFDNRKHWFRSIAESDYILIGKYGWFKESCTYSYICRKCKKVIVDYSAL